MMGFGDFFPMAGGVYLALFLAGLSGGVAHCGLMCGPFVLGQVGAKLARQGATGLCEAHRLAAAALPFYHLGRITTYAGLGALAATVSHGVLPLLGAGSLGQRALLLLGAMLFLLQAWGRWRGGTGATGGEGAFLARIGPLLRKLAPAAESHGGSYALGLLLGFLPCGLLYAALAAAAGTASAGAGALAMVAFGLGTVPALLGVGLLGAGASLRLQSLTRRLAPFLLLVNAAMLGFLAWQGSAHAHHMHAPPPAATSTPAEASHMHMHHP